MRILAIDFGLKRTGIAVTDPLQIICQPLTTVATPQIINFLTNYLQNNKVEEIVIGYPTKFDNTKAQIAHNIELLASEIKNKFNIQIVFWDEKYTSKLASKTLYNAGFKKKDRQKKENIDKIAAAIILEDYLQYKKNNNL